MNKNDVEKLNKLMTNLGLSENLAKLLIENTIENGWPKGLRTKELREKNKDVIKQMKGE